jgi:signal transduction histidine kinase
MSQPGADPGFKVVLPGETADSDIDLASKVLDNYWARLQIDLRGKKLRFRVSSSTSKKSPKTLDVSVSTTISKGFVADIRFFPRRKGVFSAKGFHGQEAWKWVRDNCGVAVVDHGFRIKPYGFPDDDWLLLDTDASHNIRDWTTEIAKEYFPVPPTKRNYPAQNPVLNLAYNLQLVGAVFIESVRESEIHEDDLVPAMDREGLLSNKGAKQLRAFVRAGLEFLAHVDKQELDRLDEEKAKAIARTARDEIKQAIDYIENIPTLVPSDKARIVKQYSDLVERLEQQEDYSSEARRNLMTMSLLGVVAGFMTHESKAVVHDLEQAVAQVRALAKKHPEIAEVADDLTKRLANFQGFLEYARMFVKGVRASKEKPLSAAGQVRHILNSFKTFADDRGIEVKNEIGADVMTPPLPVTAYSGILLNLYTNALKAVAAARSSVHDARISFRAWNEKKKHVVQVSDNGIGIPPELRKRIWEPLYTTTSDIGNPLGSGMGLGLTLVKQVVGEFGGSVSLVASPPPGFTTCFRVEFPFT